MELYADDQFSNLFLSFPLICLEQSLVSTAHGHPIAM